MSTPFLRRALVALLPAALFLAVASASACQSAATATPPPPASQGRWTKAFLESGVLVADELYVEGPPALRAHLALPQDAAALDGGTKATDDGLLHRFTKRLDDGTTIRAHLDNWQLVATRKLRVLERPGEVDVVIRAVGNAAWIPTSDDAQRAEERGNELVIRGVLTR